MRVDRSGVKPEVNAFAQAVLAGTPNELQSPELALRDLGVVGRPVSAPLPPPYLCLCRADDGFQIECMLKSGESAGSTMDITELITI